MLPLATFNAPNQPNTALFTPPTAATALTLGTAMPLAIAMGLAHGKAGLDGKVSLYCTNNVTITVYCYLPNLELWALSGATSATNSKVFDAKSVDTFVIPPNAMFFLVANGATTASVYTNSENVTP